MELIDLVNSVIIFLSQGSTNLTFACTDLRARKMVSRARLCMQDYGALTVIVGANLHLHLHYV